MSLLESILLFPSTDAHRYRAASSSRRVDIHRTRFILDAVNIADKALGEHALFKVWMVVGGQR